MLLAEADNFAVYGTLIISALVAALLWGLRRQAQQGDQLAAERHEQLTRSQDRTSTAVEGVRTEVSGLRTQMHKVERELLAEDRALGERVSKVEGRVDGLLVGDARRNSAGGSD